MVKGLLCAVLLLITIYGHAETWPDQEWAKGTPLTGAALDALDAYAFAPRDDATRQGIRTDALLVIRDGKVIYERYAAPTSASTPHLTWSVSKSLMACVLGVAYGDNRFKLSDPVARFYPPMKQHPTVTMADLLHWPRAWTGRKTTNSPRSNPLSWRCSTPEGARIWPSSPRTATPSARRAGRFGIPVATAIFYPLLLKACLATRRT